MKIAPLLLIPLLSIPLLPAPTQAYGTSGSRCYEDVWREEYVPGSFNTRGYVRRYTERVTIPCNRRQARYNEPAPRRNHDNNSCLEGTIIGGLLGGGIGGAVSRGNGRWIGVPVGVAIGAIGGCAIDGG